MHLFSIIRRRFWQNMMEDILDFCFISEKLTIIKNVQPPQPHLENCFQSLDRNSFDFRRLLISSTWFSPTVKFIDLNCGVTWSTSFYCFIVNSSVDQLPTREWSRYLLNRDERDEFSLKEIVSCRSDSPRSVKISLGEVYCGWIRTSLPEYSCINCLVQLRVIEVN